MVGGIIFHSPLFHLASASAGLIHTASDISAVKGEVFCPFGFLARKKKVLNLLGEVAGVTQCANHKSRERLT